METNATRMCELLVVFPDITVLAVDDCADEPIVVHIEARRAPAWCRGCGVRAATKDRPRVELVDLPCFGRPSRLVWRKHRWHCPEPACPEGSWTLVDTRIAPPRMALTEPGGTLGHCPGRQAGPAGEQRGRRAGCDWYTVNDAVLAYGEALLEADTDRVGEVDALGLDETLFCREGPWHRQSWCTSVAAVGGPGRLAQLIEMVPGRSAAATLDWLDGQPEAWKRTIRWGVLDLSGPHRKVFTDGLPDAAQVADPFHLVKLANSKLDECRRRVQNETLGNRGRKYDPLHRARRLLTKAHERLDERGDTKLAGLLAAGDPKGEVRMARHAKETVQSLGRTFRGWLDQITNWHHAGVSIGPTEAINKRIKRIVFGFRRPRNYRIRALLYAGRTHLGLLATVEPAEIRRATKPTSRDTSGTQVS